MDTASVKKKSGYTADSVQKRLGEIVYLEAQPERMVSRQGKHLQNFVDRV